MEKIYYSTKEMQKLGYPRDYLYQAAHSEISHLFCIKTKKGGKFLFNLKEFQRYRK